MQKKAMFQGSIFIIISMITPYICAQKGEKRKAKDDTTSPIKKSCTNPPHEEEETNIRGLIGAEAMRHLTFFQGIEEATRSKDGARIRHLLILMDSIEPEEALQKKVEPILDLTFQQFKQILRHSKQILYNRFQKLFKGLEELGIPPVIAYIIIGKPESFTISVRDDDDGYLFELHDRKEALKEAEEAFKKARAVHEKALKKSAYHRRLTREASSKHRWMR